MPALQDGLMIDSERIYTTVSNKILAPYGKEMTWEVRTGSPRPHSSEISVYCADSAAPRSKPASWVARRLMRLDI